jgi:U3 small nucleolar RNA-associated protein 21
LAKILIFGDQLLALKEDGTGLFVWDVTSRELLGEIAFHSSFTATTIMHPATYLNKVLIGSSEGEMQLWNIRTA